METVFANLIGGTLFLLLLFWGAISSINQRHGTECK